MKTGWILILWKSSFVLDAMAIDSIDFHPVSYTGLFYGSIATNCKIKFYVKFSCHALYS